MPHEARSTDTPDRLFRNSRREALAIVVIWSLFCAWVVGYCAWAAYPLEKTPADEVELVMGFPAWVFWGVALPWVVSAVVSIVFALCFIADDPIDAAEDGVSSDG